ncbi:MAG: hypothetical protein MUC83_11010 [Pirellula sp.]|nr:hypothetical protein [Pirellula sp.]
MSAQDAQAYLLPQRHAFWEWNISESSIQWYDGGTISFSDELALILDRFRVQGLPRFDCLLLVIAATRDSWELYQNNTTRHRCMIESLTASSLHYSESVRLIKLLDGIRFLPAEIRHNLNSRAMICEMCLEELVPRCTGNAVDWVLSGLRREKDGLIPQDRMNSPSPRHDEWQSDFRALTSSLERFELSKLLHRIQTGLDKPIPSPTELIEEWSDETFSDPIEARELVETLLNDAELYPIGRLAKDLLAALFRPARLTPETNSNLGGYSDISNRGTLDRLLLSELAYDNDTMAVRVSNGEALYLRREVPPRMETRDRCLLIESSIRSWGTPRVFQAAAAIALTASAPDQSKVHAWRCSGSTFERSFFTDQSGLKEYLHVLDPSLHCGGCMQELYKALFEPSHPSSSPMTNPIAAEGLVSNSLEVFLILSRESWNDPSFRELFRKSGFETVTIAVVDRFGELELISYSVQGLQPIKKIELKLADSKDKSESDLSDSLLRNQLLPKIFERDPFPLRLSAVYSDMFLVDQSLLISKLKGGGLFLWNSWSMGAIPLRACSIEGPILWARYDAGRSSLVVVVGNVSSRKSIVLNYDLTSFALQSQFEIEPCESSDQFSIEEGAILVVRASKREIEAWCLHDGKRLASVTIGEVGVANVFRGVNGLWLAAHFNGLGFDTMPISFSPTYKSNEIVLAMVAPGKDGYIGVTQDAKIIHSKGSMTAIESFLSSKLTKSDLIVQGGGRWICFKNSPTHHAIEITNDSEIIPFRLRTQPKGSERLQELAWSDEQRLRGVPRSIQQVNYRNRFDSVYVQGNSLTLLRAKNMFSLELSENGLVWNITHGGDPLDGDLVVQFTPNQELTIELGFRIESAKRNGVEVILDSRGLLHIRSVKSNLSEITIVLANGLASGWTSDGRWFGKDYHIGNNLATPSEVIQREVLSPLLRLFEGEGS